MTASPFDIVPSRFAIVLVAMTGTFATAARAASTSPSDDTAAQTDAQATMDQPTLELMEHHRHHHHGGVTQFIAMSLDTLGVSDAKRPKVDKVQSDLNACMAPARDIENNLLTTLSDGVAAGTIDTAKVDATIAQLDTVAAASHGCSVHSLNKLHAILSPTERAALVDKVQAHWDVWRQANEGGEPGSREPGSRLAELTKKVNLTPDQVDKMSEALPIAFAPLAGKLDPKKVDEHVQAFAAAFVEKSFDAKSITANANGHLATCGANRMAVFYETVTPLLTPEQRTTLAQDLREHASLQLASSGK